MAASGDIVAVCDALVNEHLVVIALAPGELSPPVAAAASCGAIDYDAATGWVYWTTSPDQSPPGVFGAPVGQQQQTPVGLATLQNVEDVTVSAAHDVYVTGAAAGDMAVDARLWRISNGSLAPVAGSHGTRLARGVGTRLFLAWPEHGGIMTLDDPASGRSPTLLVNDPPPTDLVPTTMPLGADDRDLYYGAAGELRRVAIDGSREWQTVVAGVGGIEGITVHGGSVYWLSGDGLHRVTTTGGPPQAVVVGLGKPRFLRATSAELVWIDLEPRPVVKALAWPDE
jgi:hypothetical protein